MMVIGSVEVCTVFGIVWHQSWLGTTGNDEEGGGDGFGIPAGAVKGNLHPSDQARSGPEARPNGGA